MKLLISYVFTLLQNQIQSNMQQPNNERVYQSNGNTRKIICIFMIYLFLTMTSKVAKSNQHHLGENIKEILREGKNNITLKDVLSGFQVEQVYSGTWAIEKPTGDNFFSMGQGVFDMKIARSHSSPTAKASLFINILNGQYIDEGVTHLDILLDESNLTSFSEQNKGVSLTLKQNATFGGLFQKQIIMWSQDRGPLQVQHFSMHFSLNQQSKNLDISFSVGLWSSKLVLKPLSKQNNIAHTIIFALVLGVISYFPLKTILQILKALYELRQNPSSFSLATICFTSMMDTVLCFVAFTYAFQDQDGLLLFIMQAFFLCLMWTNLQPRLMIFIYQSSLQNNNNNMRRMICKFNMLQYGSLLAIYPIMHFTNFNWIIFILMSCTLFPQIYVNAEMAIRPNVLDYYYMKYIGVRFILIFYLRCWPYNIFGLAPDYPLAFLCFLIILIQYALLTVQKIYGPKKVIPAFMLDPIFDYKLEQDLNTQIEGQIPQCSICLLPLSSQPPVSQDMPMPDAPSFKLMSTPCKHQFHSRCLATWMKIKMQCPQCRTKLPPYE